MSSRAQPTAIEIIASAYDAHKRIEEKEETEIFKDERFVQFLLYEVFCEKFGKNEVFLEYPAECLQEFMPPKKPGKPRTLDFAICPVTTERREGTIPAAVEIKLAKSCYESNKRRAIQSDLIRLSYMMQFPTLTTHCYFFMFGRKDELESVCIPGLQKKDQNYPQVSPYCWSIKISTLFSQSNFQAIYCRPQCAGMETGIIDVVDEVCIELVVDTTNSDFSIRDPWQFKTGVKVWRIHQPNQENGYMKCCYCPATN